MIETFNSINEFMLPIMALIGISTHIIAWPMFVVSTLVVGYQDLRDREVSKKWNTVFWISMGLSLTLSCGNKATEYLMTHQLEHDGIYTESGAYTKDAQLIVDKNRKENGN